jgi:3-isopropylmalate/(R)-2-methylmalate dehydratase small subunit
LTAAAERADGAEPFTVDLRAGEISGPAGLRMAFAIDAGARIALLEGLDDIGLTLRHVDLIEAWERRQAPAA